MENKKSDKAAGKRPSIDGIIGDSRQLGVYSHRSYQLAKDAQTPALDNFGRRKDGFHPMRQSQGPLGATEADLSAEASANAEEAERDALLDEPIILDEDDYSKKKKDWRKKQRPSRLRKGLKRTALALLILLLAGGAFLGYKFYKTQRSVLAGGGQAPAICDGEVPLEQLHTEGDARVNVLLLGIGGETQPSGPYLTDTIIIASVDPITDKVDLLSIPRDLYVKIPDNGDSKINEAFPDGRENTNSKNDLEMTKGGVKMVDKTLEAILKIPIHYHVVVDYEAFRQSVDSLGGIDINVPKELSVYEWLWDGGTGKNYNLAVPPGRQHFDGTKALFFARSRATPRSDFDRSERQRLMLVAIKDKGLSIGTLANPLKISTLMDSLGNNVYTDFDTDSIKCIAKQISEIPSANIKSLDLVTPPNDLLISTYLDGSTQSPKAGIYDFSQIQKFVQRSFRDGFLARENSAVAVYNATSTPGTATAISEKLKTLGYNVKEVANAPSQTNPATTVLVDLSKGKDKYTRNYLEQRLGVVATSKMPAGQNITPPIGTRFVIILGKDAAANL